VPFSFYVIPLLSDFDDFFGIKLVLFYAAPLQAFEYG
jgi:hypothetical protein